MKPEEIMLGDYVNFLIDIEGGDTDCAPKVIQYQPMKIVSFSSWVNNDGEVESAEGVINDIDQVKPILLTDEILEQNGFERVNGEYQDVFYIYDGIELLIDNVYTLFGQCKMPIKYVHELQHALRLCSINKEIEI